MILPWNDPDVPSLAVFFGGLWIGHFHYWGCNQFITQRTLAAKSLAEGQRGIMMAALYGAVLPHRNKVNITPEPRVYWMGGAVIALTALLNIYFW